MAVTVVEARVPPGRVRVVDRDLARQRTADHEPRTDAERLSGGEASAALHDQLAGVGTCRAVELVVGESTGLGRRPSEVPQGTAGHPQEEQIEHAQERKLEQYLDGIRQAALLSPG